MTIHPDKQKTPYWSSKEVQQDDPIDAMLALNLGDFVSEHLITDDLIRKISKVKQQANSPQRLKQQLEEMVSLYSLKNTLSVLGVSQQHTGLLYDAICSSLASLFQADACHIFLKATKSDQSQMLGLVGTSCPKFPLERWSYGYDLDEYPQSKLLECYETQDTQSFKVDTNGWQPITALMQQQAFWVLTSAIADNNEAIGLLVFESYNAEKPFKQEQEELAEATAQLLMTSLSMQKYLSKAQHLLWLDDPSQSEMRNLRANITELIADLCRNQQLFVESLSAAIDARSHYTQGHAKGVAELAQKMAQQMRLNEKAIDLVYYAGLLGSLGKLDIPQVMFDKPESLSDAEKALLASHPNVGVALLMKMNFLSEIIPFVKYQKAYWDGSSEQHPKLMGMDIPLGSRILAVCDAYWALTHSRSYREEPYSKEQALFVLQQEAGQKWDPQLVQQLAKMFSGV